MSVYQPLEQAIIHLIRTNNFYAQLVLTMDKKLDKSVKIAAVGVTDRLQLYVNPDYFNGLTLDERTAILMHECEHVFKNHIGRGIAINKKFNRDLNIAADRAVNQYINQTHGNSHIKITDMLSQKLNGQDVKPITKKNFDEHFKVDSLDGLSMEDYYRIVKENKPKGGGDLGEMDDHSKWDQGETNPEIVKEIIRNAVNKAAEKTVGNIPGDVQLAINDLNKSVVNWKQVLQRFVAKCVQMNVDSSRKRRSRRYGIIHPGQIKDPILRLGVAFDSSGSVDEPYLKQFFSEIKKISSLGIEIFLVEADCKVQNAEEYNPKKPIVVRGRGGTAFQPAIDKLMEVECDAIVYFTDGECFEEVKCKKPLLWALCPSYTIPKGGENNHIKIPEIKGES